MAYKTNVANAVKDTQTKSTAPIAKKSPVINQLLDPKGTKTTTDPISSSINKWLPSHMKSTNGPNNIIQGNESYIRDQLDDAGFDYTSVTHDAQGNFFINFKDKYGNDLSHQINAPSNGRDYKSGELNEYVNDSMSQINRYRGTSNGSSGYSYGGSSYRGGSGGYSGGFSSSGGLTSADRVANAKASNKTIDTVLDKLNNLPQAKQDYVLTDEDYGFLRTKFPKLSDSQLTNLVAGSDWAQNFGASVDTSPTTSQLKGATLEEFIRTAAEGNTAVQDAANTSLAKQHNSVLESIERDPELYAAVTNQLRAGAANGSLIGQRAAAVLSAAVDKNKAYKSAADALYESTGGADSDSLAGQLRDNLYNNLTGAYSGYTEQQLNKLASDTALQTKDINDLVTMLSLVDQGLVAEDAAVNRLVDDETTRIQNEAEARKSKVGMEADMSVAEANAALDVISNMANLATTVATSGDGNTTPVISNTYKKGGGAAATSQAAATTKNAEEKYGAIIDAIPSALAGALINGSSLKSGTAPNTTPVQNRMASSPVLAPGASPYKNFTALATSATPTTSTPKDTGAGVYNKAEMQEAPYIDETLYKTLTGKDYTKFISQDAFDRYTKPKSQAELAHDYGLEDLLDVNSVANKFQQYQQQANEASNEVFNAAQQAYVMAIAAGDAKTAEQLTKLAQQASVGRRNVFGASALANQFTQQHNNAAVSDDIFYAGLQQRAANNAASAAAAQAGRAQWNTWVGNGNANTAGNGFNQSYTQQQNNASQALAAYGDIIGGAMKNQTGINNAISSLTNSSNTVLTDYASALNKLNSNAAKTNIANSATVAGMQNTLQTQKQVNTNTINKGGK